MEHKISKSEGQLLDLMKERGVNRDSCNGTLAFLETQGNADNNYKQVFRWIKQNPHARQTEILRYVRATYLDKAATSAVPTAVRKIAVL